jgi:hypothetical protein
MKIKIYFLVLFIILTSGLYSQFDKPVLQLGIGLVEPFDDLKGTYYRNVDTLGLPLMGPNTDLYSNNYGAKTGLYFFGKGKINFDKYNIFRAVGSISFSTFNTFESSKNGNIARVVHIDTNTYIYPVGTTFNYTFNAFSISLGLEVAPSAFTNIFSPFFGANIVFNSFSSKLSRTGNGIDTITFSNSGFRIGFNFDAGIEAKFTKNIGMVLGVKYDLGNVLLKNTYSGIADAYDWGSTNASLNDDEGQYFTSIQNPLLSSDLYLVNAKKKSINWGTIYLGINIYFDTHKTTKKKTGNK